MAKSTGTPGHNDDEHIENYQCYLDATQESICKSAINLLDIAAVNRERFSLKDPEILVLKERIMNYGEIHCRGTTFQIRFRSTLSKFLIAFKNRPKEDNSHATPRPQNNVAKPRPQNDFEENYAYVYRPENKHISYYEPFQLRRPTKTHRDGDVIEYPETIGRTCGKLVGIIFEIVSTFIFETDP